MTTSQYHMISACAETARMPMKVLRAMAFACFGEEFLMELPGSLFPEIMEWIDEYGRMN